MASSDNKVVAATSEKKPTPEQLLQQLETDEEYQATARLKIFLGYSSGVGKSFRMLDEGRRRHQRGQDVVVGAIQPMLSAELAQTVSTLEIIPLKLVDGVSVMDLPVILRRKPKVCLVDGLAYDNPPELPAREAVARCRAIAQGRHLGHYLGQSSAHRRKAGARRGHHRQTR